MAEHYNQQLLERLRFSKCRVTAEVFRGETVKVILETSRRIDTEVIIMGTHGKVGTEAFWEGSVTPRVFNRSKAHLLLVPVTIR